MVEWVTALVERDKVTFILTLILIANILDFLFGWVNARLNDEVKFSSTKAIHGIARKMLLFTLAVFFVPVSVIAPQPIGEGALWVFLVGYLLSEINSILTHLKLTDDDKAVHSVFGDFIGKILNGKRDVK